MLFRSLKGLLKSLRPESHGLIVRTAAEGASEEDLRHDVDRLVQTWEDIEKRSKKAKAPSTLYEEPELTVRVVRDLFTDEEYRELATDSRRVHELVTGYLREIAPDLVEKVRLHEGPLPVFEEFHIVEQIHKALDRKVWLPSGGSLIIEHTEALTVIDVNTGKNVGTTNLEETVFKNNLEAAEEVAKQLRLRDIGGIVVIDFIDMEIKENRRRVVEAFRAALARDKTRTQVFDISELGLVEMTRKRVRDPLQKRLTEDCRRCDGHGRRKTVETVAVDILRRVERAAAAAPGKPVRVRAAPVMVRWLDAHEAEIRAALAKRGAARVSFEANNEHRRENFDVETVG